MTLMTDIELLVTQIYGTELGDFDLYGHVGRSDYTILASHFGQTPRALWSDGDTNGDGNVNGPDFTTLTSNFGCHNGQGHINTTEFLFGFTGRIYEYDIEVGLQNNLHRWYDAVVGAWISQDPIGFKAGDANLYRYVGNGATRWVDPSGLLTFGVSGGGTLSVLWWHGSLDLEGHVGISWEKGISFGWGHQCSTAKINKFNGLGLGANAGLSGVVTTANTVGQLDGDAIAAGAHAAVGPAQGSAEVFAGDDYVGIEVSPPFLGFGAGAGVYINENDATIYATQ